MGRFLLPQLFNFDPPTLDGEGEGGYTDEPGNAQGAGAGAGGKGLTLPTARAAALLPSAGVKLEPEEANVSAPNSSKSRQHQNLKIKVNSPTGTSGFPSGSADVNTPHSYMGGITPLSSAGLNMASMPRMSPASTPYSASSFVKMSPRMGESPLHSPNSSFKVRVTLLLHCCCTVVARLLHCCYIVVTLLLHCCYTVVTLLLHCCDTVVTLLLHCCCTVVTLLLHCCYTVVTLL
jgi:hypothetical protein